MIRYAQLAEQASEMAEIKVHALLQTFALPQVDEEQIENLLRDAIATSFTAGFVAGWDESLEAASKALSEVERYRGGE